MTSDVHSLIAKMESNLHAHSVSDERFQDKMMSTLDRLEKKIDDQRILIDAQKKASEDVIEVYTSLSTSSKLILKVSGVLVAIVGAIAALKYLLVGILK